MAVAVREWRNSGDDRRRAAVRACARTASICAHAVMAAWRRRRPFQSARAASEAVVDEHDAGAKRRHGEPRRAHRRGKRQFAAGDPGTAHEPILQLRRQRRQRLEHVGGIVGSGAPIGQRPFTAAAMAAASASLAAIVAARSVVTVSAGTVCAATRCTWR